jgi:hypothetical protein
MAFTALIRDGCRYRVPVAQLAEMFFKDGSSGDGSCGLVFLLYQVIGLCEEIREQIGRDKFLERLDRSAA